MANVVPSPITLQTPVESSRNPLPPPLTMNFSALDDLAELDPPPAYSIDFKEVVRRWGEVCGTSRELDALDTILNVTETELNAARKELDALKRRSAEHFQTLHAGHSSSRFSKVIHHIQSKAKKNLAISPSSSQDKRIGTRRESSTTPSQNMGGSCVQGEEREDQEDRSSPSVVLNERETAAVEFEKAHAVEMRQATTVAELEGRVTSARSKRNVLLSNTMVKEDIWAQLQHVASGLSPHSPELALQLGEAVETLHTVETQLSLATQRVVEILRARQSVQHSHHYLTKALKICDDLGISKKRDGAVGMFGGLAGIGRITDYQDSVRLASCSQVCLAECIRVVSPYTEALPEGIKEDYMVLKENGVLQMAKIYNLVFGGRMIDSGVGKQIQYMLNKQDKVFTHLTQLAVWIQNEVPISEAAEKGVIAARDMARTRLVDLWVETAEHR